MTGREVDLILDTSAVVAFSEGALAVGETIAEVADEGALTVVPLLCLAAAAAQGAESTMLGALARNPSVRVAADESGEWRALAESLRLVSDFPTASAALAATDWGCQILTCAPKSYENLDGGGPLIIF